MTACWFLPRSVSVDNVNDGARRRSRQTRTSRVLAFGERTRELASPGPGSRQQVAPTGRGAPTRPGLALKGPTDRLERLGSGAAAGRSQYDGCDGSIWLTHATTPPPTCTASENPAPFTTARASAERAPVLQCSTTFLAPP